MMNILLPGLSNVGVIPVLVGPIQVLLTLLPALLAALGGVLLALFKPSTVKAGLKVLWRNKVSFSITIALIGGLIYGGIRLRERLAPKGATVTSGDWPAFRGGVERRGGDGRGPDPVAGGVVWSFTRSGKTFYSSPALVGNSVIVVSADKGVMTDQGGIYRLDAATGDKQWEYAPRGFRATYSSPSVQDNFLVCGEGLHETYDGRVVCLDARDGRLLWSYQAKSHVESSPCISNGKVFCGAGADGFYGFALSVPAGVSNLLWHVPGSSDGQWRYHCDGSPAAADGRVIFGSAAVHPGDWNGIICLDANTGKQLWSLATPYPVFGSPTVVEGKVIVGMGNGDFVFTAEEVRIKKINELKERHASPQEILEAEKRLGPAGEVWCLNAADGKVVWSNQFGRTILGAVAYANGRLYVGSCDNSVTCMGMDGKVLRTWDARESIKISPSVGKEHVYVLTDSGRLYALDLQTLRPVWDMRVGTGNLFSSSPVVGNGHVYVGTSADGFLCVGSPEGREKDEIWAGAMGGPGKGGWADKSTPSDQGRFEWRYPEAPATDSPEGTAPAVPKMASPVAMLEGTVYAGFSEGRKGLAALALNKDRKKKPVELWFRESSNGVYRSAVVAGDFVWFVDGKPGDSGRLLRRVNRKTGTVSATWPVETGASGELLLGDKWLVIADRVEGITLLETEKELKARWIASVKGLAGAPAEKCGIILAASGTDKAVVALSIINGAVLWKRELEVAPVTGPIGMGEANVAVGTTKGVAMVGLIDGAEKWSSDCGSIAAPLVANAIRIVCVTESRAIVVLGVDGREQMRVEGATAGIAPVLTDDTMICILPESVQRVDLANGRTSTWLARTAWMGGATTPGVLWESHLYFGTANNGLVSLGPK
ncbi:MAG: PQQ-binding-like beta-propeller repeat protein [bacterium]